MRKGLIAAMVASLMLAAITSPALAQENMSKTERRQLIRKGAQLWGVYCNQCHNARPGSEKAPYEWEKYPDAPLGEVVARKSRNRAIMQEHGGRKALKTLVTRKDK